MSSDEAFEALVDGIDPSKLFIDHYLHCMKRGVRLSKSMII